MANTQAVRKPPTRQLPAPPLPFGSASPFLLPTSDPCFFHSGSRRPCPAPASLPACPPDSRSILPSPSTSISQTSTPGPLPHASMLSVAWEGRSDTKPYNSVTALPEQCGDASQAWEEMGGAGCGPAHAVRVLQGLRRPLLSEVPLVDNLGGERKVPTNRTSHQ